MIAPSDQDLDRNWDGQEITWKFYAFKTLFNVIDDEH